MRRFAVSLVSIAVLILGCDQVDPLEPARHSTEAMLAKGGPPTAITDYAVRTALPPLERNVGAGAYAVNQAGTLVGGWSWDRAGLMHPVTWTMQNGSWVITALPLDASATRGVVNAVNDQGDKAGTFFQGTSTRP